jgi:DNA-binding response OmpR family regulator
MQPLILIIEDSSSQALRLRLLLERAGYRVQVASDGISGVQQAQNEAPALILLDVNLPCMNGFDVLAALKHNTTTCHISIVMLTSEDSIDDVERAIELGADGYLFKDDCFAQANGLKQIFDVMQEVTRNQTRCQTA